MKNERKTRTLILFWFSFYSLFGAEKIVDFTLMKFNLIKLKFSPLLRQSLC